MADKRRFVTAEPENSETPLEQAGSWVTPNRLFFVRNHFAVPEVDAKTWRLRIDGCVDHPRDWSLAELATLPERTVFATMECAGNGRSFLSPHVHGVQWGAGAIGHAEWTGVPLRLVLEKSGVKPETKEILFEGLDSGREADHPEPLTFARSLPLDKAMHRDTLLVTKMNGEPLEPIHGFPLRLLVPGWYGFGSAVEAYLATASDPRARREKMTLLKAMAHEWPFFHALTSNMEMALAKTDLSIAARYARLASNPARGRAIFRAIQDEWALTVKHWLAISGQRALLESNPTLARNIRNRLPYLNPLNHLQVELIKRHRQGRGDRIRASDDRTRRGIHLTINGISAGLRNTG